MLDNLLLHPSGDYFVQMRDYLAAQLPGYNIWGRIHHGSQGIVFYAYQEMSKRPVAVKVLLDGPLADEEQLNRFRREIELISRLDHPGIVSLYECGVIVGRPYYTMSYIDGLPITEHVLLHTPTVRQCAELFIHVCDALSYAHQNGVIHRDLKPGNILVDHQAKPYLVDFGLAKSALQGSTLTGTGGRAVGTLAYLSPEQAHEDDAGTGDVRSDIYSLGVVMFEVLSGGAFPYPINGTPGQTRQNIINREPVSLRAAVQHPDSSNDYQRGDISPDLAGIVAKALHKEPHRRYRSADELADDLRNYLSGRAVQARSGSTLYRIRKAIRAYRMPLLFVGLLFATVVSLWLKADSDRRAAQTTLASNAALQIGSHLRLGSFARDSGRVDDAAKLLQLSLQIAQNLPDQENATVRTQLFRTYRQLAEMYYLEDQPQQADPYCQVAMQLANRLIDEDPSRHEYQYNLSLAYILDARRHIAEEDFQAASQTLDSAISLRQQLLAADPDNEDLLIGLAVAHALNGRCIRALQDYSAAWKHYAKSYEIRLALYESDPDSDSHTLELLMSENKLATWHINQDSPQDDERAMQWLERAAERIRVHKEAGRLSSQLKDTERIESAIRQNMAILAKRQNLYQARQPQQAHPPLRPQVAPHPPA